MRHDAARRADHSQPQVWRKAPCESAAAAKVWGEALETLAPAIDSCCTLLDPELGPAVAAALGRLAVRLRSGRIVCPRGTTAGEVVIESSRIAAVTSTSTQGALDLGHSWLVPGYIDPHVHGGGGAQCNTDDPDEIAAVADFHARHGTTCLVAATVAAPLEELQAALIAIAQSRAATLLGAHLEGPFLSPKRPGAMDPSLFRKPDRGQLQRLLAAAPGITRVVTLAPELPGALGLIETLARENIVVSLGHTDATDQEVRDAAQAGARSATHVFNAMAPLHHRAPGVLGAVLDLPELSCELICDGVHVDPVAMRLVYRAKGADGVRLVTDAMAAAGMPDGEYRLGGRPVTVKRGRAMLKRGESIAIAGSTLTMEAAVQNAVRLLGVSVEQAVRMAATNSARLLNLPKGEITEGLDADLLVLDDNLAVQATMVAGQWLFGPP